MSSVANACTRAAHACTKFLRGHLGFRRSCARLRIRSLWARNAHLCTSSARGARLVPFQHAAGHVQAASSPRYPPQGARTVEKVRTENICTHTHRQLSSVRHFSPHTLPSDALATCATSEESQRERVIQDEGEREREKDTESACRRERVTRRSLVLPTLLSPPAAHLGHPNSDESGASLFLSGKKISISEEAERWRLVQGSRSWASAPAPSPPRCDLIRG